MSILDNVPQGRLTVTIASGESLSDASTDPIPLGTTICGLLLPATWTAAKVSLLVSYDGTTFAELADIGSGAGKFVTDTLTVVSSTPIQVPLAPAMMASVRYIKVKSGTLSSATNQTGAKTITIITRPAS